MDDTIVYLKQLTRVVVANPPVSRTFWEGDTVFSSVMVSHVAGSNVFPASELEHVKWILHAHEIVGNRFVEEEA